MALNDRPWVKSEADAAKCLNHLREKEGRVFNLDKAKEVLDSVKADHVKFYPNIPFKPPNALGVPAHPRALQRYDFVSARVDPSFIE